MAQFVWVTDNYRVNLDAIFSLECRYIPDNSAVDEWNKIYERWLNDIKEYGLHTDDLDIDTTEGISDIEFDQIDDYILQMIGECPKASYTVEYHIILSTGVTMQIAEDKFNKICEVIDSIS